MSTSSERRRIAPRERFAGSEKQFNLDAEFASLPDESTVRQGHMQKAIYRHGRVTTAIFDFEAEGGIDQHKLEGESTLHVLEGQLFVQTSENEYTLSANELLLLDPGIAHDLKAVTPTRVLMTVVLDDGK